MADIAAAEQFLAAHARVLDRRRYERLFQDGPAGPVRDAVAAYRTADGGFGHGLEPDGRGPDTQPAAISLALRTLHEADAWDDDLAGGALDWLQAHAPAEGGATFVDPSVEGWPAAPWWRPQDGLPTNAIFTGLIAAVLHAHGAEHPWRDGADQWLWRWLDDPGDAHPYDVRAVLTWLAEVRDDRVDAAVDRLGALLQDRDLVALDPEAEGEVHGPLDYAPLPGSPGRRFFADDVIDAHLEHLAAAQRDDGGWTFNWLAWSPVAESEWRGSLTVDALVLLRANGRLPGT
jgi:hypothetical protein